MTDRNARKRGISLIELIIVIGIMALLIGMLLPAIQAIREASVQAQSVNNLRQIILGVHQYAGEQNGEIKDIANSNDYARSVGFFKNKSIFVLIAPYTHHPNVWKSPSTSGDPLDAYTPHIRSYLSPADPTLETMPLAGFTRAKCSYAVNLSALDGFVSMSATFRDGMSTTIGFAEKHFAAENPQTYGTYEWVFGPLHANEVYGQRCASFADKRWGDVVPATDAVNARTISSLPGKTFQYKPRIQDVDPHVAHTQFRSGLPVAMFDGSCRTLSKSIDESAFWSMVTPAKGDFVQE